MQDLNKIREEHESFSAVASGSQAISRSEAATDAVLKQLMAPSAIEVVVAALQKRKGVRPYGVSSDILQTGGSAAAVQLADRIRGRRDIAMSDSKRSIKGGESMTITLRHKRKNYFFKRYTGQNDSSVGHTPSFKRRSSPKRPFQRKIVKVLLTSNY